MDGDDRLMGVEEGLVSRNWLAMPIHRWRCSRVDWRRVGHPRARMTRPSIGRRSAVRGSATNSGPDSDHHMKREQIPGTGGKQDDHGATANHRGVAKRMRVNPSTVRRWRLDDVGPPYLRVGTVYRYSIGAVEAWIAESVRRSIAS